MSSLVISGDTSGTVTLAAPAVAGSNTITVQAATGTMSVNTLATSVASTSGTSIDFTGLPSWIKRITVQFQGVSTNGTSVIIIQLGTGSTTFTTTGYLCSAGTNATIANYTTGIGTTGVRSAAYVTHGATVFTNITGNSWVAQGTNGGSDGATISYTGGSIALGAALTAVRVTTVNGTDLFDAGTINILYEG
jgi:hypothetical protein